MSKEETLKNFHGNLYTPGPWNSVDYDCCRLCKTKNSKHTKTRHWAKGLCRSCYRRLSLTHRLYNDRWAASNSTAEIKKSTNKKEYKTLKPEDIDLPEQEVSTLLERYNFSCAYCFCKLQDHSASKGDAFQLEFILKGEDLVVVPICRGCNCSKKNLTDEIKLRRWAIERGLDYPFTFISADEYLAKLTE